MAPRIFQSKTVHLFVQCRPQARCSLDRWGTMAEKIRVPRRAFAPPGAALGFDIAL